MFSGEGKAQLIAAFIKAQPKFGVPKRTKTARVQTRTGGNYTYQYSSLEDLIAATRPALSENGLACFCNVKMPGLDTVTVSAVLVHDSGETHESEPLIFKIDGTPHSVGAAITYGRRYSMGALLGVAAEDDNDAAEPVQQQGTKRGGRQQQAASNEPAQEQPQGEQAQNGDKGEGPITEAQLARLKRIVKEAGVSGRSMKAWLNGMDIKDSASIKRNQYDLIVSTIQSGKVPDVKAAEAK